MQDYFNNQMRMAGMAGPEGEPIISCQVNLDKNFAFLEVCWCLLRVLNIKSWQLIEEWTTITPV